MYKTVKIFCSGSEQERLVQTLSVIERYQGFILASIQEKQIPEYAANYPMEDITDQYTVRLDDQVIDTSQPRVDTKGKEISHPAYKGKKRLPEGPHHYLVQFVGPIKEEWLSQVKKVGGRLRAPFESFCYIVQLDSNSLAKVATLPFVRWVGHLPHDARIDPSALANVGRKAEDVYGELPRTRILPGLYEVEFFDEDDMKAGIKQIEEYGFDILEKNKAARLLLIQHTKADAKMASRLKELSAIHGVCNIRERSFMRISNDVATRIMATDIAVGQSGLQLSGDGEVIGICDTGIDTGDPESIHPDFEGRVAAVISYPITNQFSRFINNPEGNDGPADLDSGHGTHVAGSVLGSGAASVGLAGVNGAVSGLAKKAKLVFQAVEQEMKWKNLSDYQRLGRYLLSGIPHDLRTLFADAYELNARIHSNSWGGGSPGVYGLQCSQLDRFVWEHKDFCVLVAAGNDGTDQDGDGKINPMSVTSPGTAKNCITVGASENDRPAFSGTTYGGWWPNDYPVPPYRTDPMSTNTAQLAAFSSRGPTKDGRIKPEVVAPGTFVLSTRSTMIASNNRGWSGFPSSKMYFYMGGTSMATPLCAGVVALIREYLRKQKKITSPSAALLKASLIAGAIRLPGYGAAGAVSDNEQGFGRINLDAVLAPSSPVMAEFIDITPGLRTGEIYTKQIDIASNNFPLRIVMAYSDYPGSALVNNLNLIITSPEGKRYVGNQAVDGLLNLDTKNNVEVVHITRPVAGKWSFEISGSNIPQGPQDFALVILAHTGVLSTDQLIQLDTSPKLAIPDNSTQGVVSEIEVSQAGIINSFRVGVEITHSYIGDLRVSLTAPDGSNFIFHDRSGASANDIIQNYDVHTTPSLGALNGMPIQGTWKLNVADLARRDKGKLQRWNLEIGLAPSNTIRAEQSSSLKIPDNNPDGISDTLAVKKTGVVQSIKIWLDITHTYIGDLRVQLIAPSGKTVLLHDRSGGNQDNLIKTYDAANLPLLQELTGEKVKGSWILKVFDLAGRDVGKLNHWGVEVSI